MSDPLATLRVEITADACGGYDVRHDLACVSRARDADVREATVFYAARILEALSAEAVNAVGLEGKENAFANLTRLGEHDLLPTHTRYWAHALRRLGNGVRHAHSQTTPAEQEGATAFLEYWLRWFFCTFALGPRLEGLTTTPNTPLLIRDPHLLHVLDMAADDGTDPGQIARELLEGPCDAAAAAAPIVAVLAERLTEANRLDEAHALLIYAIEQQADDLRLQQLLGLVHSRSGRLDEAIALLDPLYKRYRNDDEMAGIMAGVYKRKWRAEDNDHRWLAKSHKAYRAAWKQDRDNTYLGINVASTSLFLDDLPGAQTVADHVHQTLLARQEVLARHHPDSTAALDLWDRLTLVEAELLSGAETAPDQFRAAAADHPQAAGALAVACRQFLDITARTGKPDEVFRQFLQQVEQKGDSP